MNLEVIVICGHTWLDQFMRDADVFERTRAYGEPITIMAEKDGDIDIPGLLTAIKEGLEKRLNYRVSAIFCVGRPEGAWKDPHVQTISNGKKWCLLDDMCKAYGWPEGVT